MVALQIRDVPDDVRDVLSERASGSGQSLQAYLLALVTREAARSANVDVLRHLGGRDDGSRLTSDEAAAVLDEVRAER